MDIIMMAVPATPVVTALGAAICRIMKQARLSRRDKLDSALLFYLADKDVPREVLRTLAEIRKPEPQSVLARRLRAAQE
jgi:hypothetical protein